MTKILVDKSVLEQVLEALEFIDQALPWPAGKKAKDAITALRAALAEPVQETMYWEVRCTAHPKWMRVDEQQFDEYVSNGWEGQKLYTALPTEKIGKNL